MAAITPTNVKIENLGSLTLLINRIQVTSTSDTYTLPAGSPVVASWTQSVAGQGLPTPDVTYTNSTGVFLFSSGTTVPGATDLFILMRT